MKIVVEMLISAIIIWITYYSIGKILFTEKNIISKYKTILTTMIFSVVLTVFNLLNSEVMQGIIKFIVSYSLFCLYYKIVYKKDMS